MPRISLSDGRVIAVPDDIAPDQLDAMLAELSQVTMASSHGPSGSAPAAAEAEASGAAGPEADLDAVMAQAEKTWGTPTLPGLTQVGGAVGPIRSLLGKAAPGLMRNALGAQQSVRNRFPTVDLDDVALREGAIPGAAASIDDIAAKSGAAGKAVKDTVAAAGPATVVTAREVVRGVPGQRSVSLRSLFKDAKAAKRTDVQEDILKRVQQIRREYGPGLDMTGAQARKQILAQEGKSALRAPTSREAAMGSQLANAERKAITQIMRRNPDVAAALDRSQELMALERAMQQTGRRTSILRDALAAAAGTTAGVMSGNPAAALITAPAAMAANRAATSPQTMGRLAQVLHRTGRTQSSGEFQALLAQLLQLTQDPTAGSPR